MPQESFKFPKKEKLCSHIVIEELFSKGESFVCFPFRVIYLPTELPEDVPAQVLFSVSKRRFKRAVHRNLLKRRSREAYRLTRGAFIEYLEKSDQQIAFAMVYISGDQLPYAKICKGMKKGMKKLEEKLIEKQAKEDVVD
ncbi:ribonuclease P protein component [Labilibacter marinus]|uniref:ribonuclease P protein component n=1 Tax=Labilibacter marinus TaxID=1477105 RepID=UPI00082A9482|nr:ribonuclease P protein component [Labilibacter marinus]